MSFLSSVVSQSSWFCSNTCFHSGHQQVANPIIPYVGPIISGGLKPGMALYIQGVVPDNANQFSINLQTGQNKYDDIAFHFNPWIGQNVYLNSFQNGNWALRDCVPDESFTKGAAFNMFIVINTDGYEVYVNDLRRYMFQHRIPLDRVTTLAICGDVSIDFFGLCENWRRTGFTEQAVTSTGRSFSSFLPVPSEVSQQVIQPVLPHVGKIRDRLKPEMAVFFQGALPAHPKEFEINFQTGQSDSDDIAFHFNPRIGQYVSLNSFRNGSWDKEERVSDELFTKEAAFYMFVVIGLEGFEVYVNGLQLCRFNHRVPLENISTISIYGDVTIPIYGFIDNWNRSFTFTDFLKITGMGSSFPSLLPILSDISHPVILPTIPYVGTIRGGLKPDMAVFFQGTLPAHAKKFAINFQTGQSDSDDIAFHFNPCIGQYVCLNSYRNASWEQEESTSEKPFTKGAAFNMFIIINSEGYEVHVNGVQLCIFKHRIPLENITTLAIFGDISISIFSFIDNWSRSPLCMDQSNVTGCRSLFSKHLSIPSEISHPVIQPALPYMGSIKEEIRPDMALLFHGVVSEHGKSFEINLLTGDSGYDDIAFHISPHIGKSVALNSFMNGSWETEEYASDNPFSKGASFQMFFVINSEGYDVFVNNLKHCTFKHHIPLEKVSTLGIRGDVSINYFGFVENWSASSVARKMNELTISGMHIPLEISHPVVNPELPYRGPIPEGLRTDMAVTLQGALPADAKEFTINFQTGKNDGDDIAFHINPRIGDLVALNSFRNGSWETEEHASVTAFAKEEALDMSIAINSEGYEVYVNGLHHCTFKHRIPLEKVSTLGIFGDVNVKYFGFVENWSNSSNFKKINEITTGSLIDVRPEISAAVSNPEIPYVGVIPQGLKTDMGVMFQVSLPADTNDAVIFKNIHHETENLNEASMTVELNEIQNTSLTSGSLIDVPAEISHPVSDPEIPYVGTISGGLKTDMAVVFQGALPADSKEFTINFQTGKNDGDDIAFHINPRIGDLVALNSFRNGSWETEEHASVTAFAKEEALDMSIGINSEGYEVYVNGLHHCTFKHRIPLEKVSTLGIFGDVNIKYFGFLDNWSNSSIFKKISEIQDKTITTGSLIDVRPEISAAVSNPEIPYVGVIPQGLKTDMGVMFQVSLPADTNDAVIFKNIHHETENLNEASMTVELNEIQNTSLTSGSLIDVPAEISHPVSDPELQYVGVINQRLKTNRGMMFKVSLPADANDAVNLNTFHHGSKVGATIFNVFSNETWRNEFLHKLSISGDLMHIPSEISHPVIYPELPYRGPIPEGLRTDMAVTLQGALPADAKEFTINFQTGKNDGDDVAFHINPRIGDLVALNSFRNGSWETEEHASVTAFAKEAALDMSIGINSEGYEVYVNGLHQCTFKHRIPLEKVSTLGIFGDVNVKYFGFLENWSNSSIFKKINEIQDKTITTGSLIDVCPEISPAVSNPEIPYVGVIPQGLKIDRGFMFQVALPTEANDAVNLRSIHHGSEENIGESSMIVKMNEIQDTSLASGSLMDVPEESNPELQYVGVISQGLKTDMGIMFQVSLPADANDAVTVKSIHHESEDTSVTSGSLIDVPAEISHPISNPEIPYVGAIPGGLKTDMAVVFQGALPADSKEFTVNFQTGKNDGDDIAFHINPRIGDLVALNSFRNGSWETEEHASVTAFAKEGALNMSIAINSEGYEVYVNGLHHCTFKHRIPLEKVSTLGIVGDVNVKYFGFVENWSSSSLALRENKELTLLPITSDKLALPFVSTIPGGIRADMAVLFCGTVFADSNEFEINFQTGQSSDDIAFNINPQIVRFLVLSSLRKGSWESEDLASDKGAAFNMFVAVRLEGYEVFVNGLRYCMFKHRIPSETISSLGIRGDVFVNFIGLIDNWSSCSMVMEKSCWRPIPISSQLSHPFSNLVLPYVGVIPGKARPDMAILFQGALPADANEFTINFQTGDSNGDDIAFHINPQLGHHVAINSFRNGSWETEESVSDKPFTKGASFNVFVVIKSEHYEVYVNGLELCTFKHRIPVENISTLGISGDVSINFIGFIETWSKFSFIIENNELTGMRSSSWRRSSQKMISTSA
ncbi:uncharacterized protein LOC131351660 isoform X2 [Hemibagrus wyckioides]|uniref:uncharacterized protein LOC131351660 isoform X2 n=1 Tax=Hemibagrus wyckioides TaxID=337641 RepID=UPI00266B9CF5|nr:uncharacterized protein LOC131351660 isoform X2 [Hemibagrus wyckioides]